IGEGFSVVLTGTPAGGTWSTSNGNATVVDGTLTGITAGDVTVTYTTEAGCIATVSIHVIDCGGKAAHATGVATVSSENVRLYPNPATSVLHINANEKVNVSVLSVDGKMLIDQK